MDLWKKKTPSTGGPRAHSSSQGKKKLPAQVQRRSSDVSPGPSTGDLRMRIIRRRSASSRFAGMGTASSMAPASHLASSKSVDAPDTDGDSYGFSRSSAFDAPASYSRWLRKSLAKSTASPKEGH